MYIRAAVTMINWKRREQGRVYHSAHLYRVTPWAEQHQSGTSSHPAEGTQPLFGHLTLIHPEHTRWKNNAIF